MYVYQIINFLRMSFLSRKERHTGRYIWRKLFLHNIFISPSHINIRSSICTQGWGAGSCNNVALPYFTFGYLPGTRNIKILKIRDGYVIAAREQAVFNKST